MTLLIDSLSGDSAQSRTTFTIPIGAQDPAISMPYSTKAWSGLRSAVLAIRPPLLEKIDAQAERFVARFSTQFKPKVSGDGGHVRPVKMKVLAPQTSQMPMELRAVPRWVVWKLESRGDAKKPTKVPYCSTLKDSRASSTDPATWSTFSQAEAAYEEGGYDGLGIVLNGDGLVSVDLDDCIEDGEVTPQASILLDSLGAAYIEKSPSGNGLRAFGYADNLDTGVSGKYDGVKVELYSHSRFMTITGHAIENGPLGQLNGFTALANSIRTDKRINHQTGELERSPADTRQAELMRRILSGEVYHDSLRDYAAALAASGTAPGMIVQFLRALMDQSSAPHDARWAARKAEIPTLVSSAARKYSSASINIDRITGRAPVVIIPPSTIAPSVAAKAHAIPSHLLSVPGRLGMMVDWTNQTSSKPQPMFAVQAALALGSVAMGRKFRTNLHNWPSLYFLNIAVSGAGKEHAKTAIERCLQAAELMPLIGPCEYTSDSAVDSALLDKPTHIAVIDEFGLLLEAGKAKNNPNGGTARKRLMEMFGRSHSTLQPKAYSLAALSKEQRDARGSRVVENPALSLMGMTTPGTFYNAVGSGSLTDGFLNRFIIVESDLGRQLSQDNEYIEPPDALVRWVKACRIVGVGDIALNQIDVQHSDRPTPTVIPFTASALDLFKELEVVCLHRMDELEVQGMSEMYTRVREIAMKVSLIVAHSCEAPEIDLQHAQWAIDYVRYWADRSIISLAANVADSPFAALCNDVANFIQKAGRDGLTEADLARKSAKFKGADSRMRKYVFENLASDRGVCYCEFRPPSGRGKSRFVYIMSEFQNEAQLEQ